MRRLTLLLAMPFVIDALVAWGLAAGGSPVHRQKVGLQSAAGANLVTYPVFFDWDRVDLSQQARAILAEAAGTAASGRITLVELHGDGDTPVNSAYAGVLARLRAGSVAVELARLGVVPGRILVTVAGPSPPFQIVGREAYGGATAP
jgi:outer membrane protein OmpA-like peptidoglycan-associated protein